MQPANLSNTNTTLFIGDLSVTCSEPQLLNLFLSCGGATSVRIIRTRKRASLGYAFVTMISEEAAQHAINQLHGALLCGRNIRVCHALDEKRASYSTSDQSYGSPEDMYANPPNNNNYYSSNSNTNMYSSNEENNLNSPHDAHGAAAGEGKQHANSIYFKFQCPVPKSTDEGVLRHLICSQIGDNSVSDITIRRISDDGVSLCNVLLVLFVP